MYDLDGSNFWGDIGCFGDTRESAGLEISLRKILVLRKMAFGCRLPGCTWLGTELLYCLRWL